jgi:hypothetical protein
LAQLERIATAWFLAATFTVPSAMQKAWSEHIPGARHRAFAIVAATMRRYARRRGFVRAL